MSSIILDELIIGYTDKAPLSQPIHLEIKQGETIAFIGKNGVGKSTLLKTVCGRIKKISGHITIDGKNDLSQQQKSRYLSVVTTGNDTLTHFSVEESIALGRHPYTNVLGTLQPKDKEIIDETILLLKIERLRRKKISELSDGEKQRVAIARALVQETPFLILDEPTAHLDYPSRIELFQLLTGLARKKNIGILLCTHELNLCERFQLPLWCYFPDGRVISLQSDQLTEETLNCLFSTDVF